jgi:hypothetical protein
MHLNDFFRHRTAEAFIVALGIPARFAAWLNTVIPEG